MSTTIICVFCFPLVFWVAKTFYKTVSNKDKFNVAASSAEIDRFKNQVAAGLTTLGFIVGSVCFEIFTSEANSDKAYQNKFYFLMMSFAFSFGLSAVIVSTLILLCLGELTTNDKKNYFVATLRKVKLGIFILSMGCIITWQASILALSKVKYTGDKGGGLQSFIPGLFGLVMLLRYYYGIKKVSDGIRVNGCTVTKPAVLEGTSVGVGGAGGGGVSPAAHTTLSHDASSILNPLVIEHGPQATTASFEVEKMDSKL